MAVKFEFYESPVAPDKKKKVRYHPRVVSFKTVETDQIIYDIRKRCSLTPADILATLSALKEALADRLREGQRVHLEGIGYFQVTLSAPETRNPKDTRANQVKFKSVKFRADQELKGELLSLKAERSNFRPHSARLSEIEIDQLLTTYFEENQVITRHDFQVLCTMTRVTAGRHINRLIEAKKLKNINTRYQPIYVPVPGNYHVSVNVARNH